ncbi:MAG: TIGR03016 family PEP-CTERM system-associated outer membrane protein, partial [Acetobacteraceae bacterium]
AAAPPPPGMTVAPDSPFRPGTLGFPFTTLYTAPVGPPRAWTITPSLGLSVTFNDNIRNTPRNREADLIFGVTPGILVRAETARLQGTLNYTPTASFYAKNSNQNQLVHRGFGQMSAILVPDLLFLDARASASVQSLSGGFAQDDNTAITRNDQVQTFTASLSPYIVQRFRGLATMRAGYIYSFTDQSRSTDRRVPSDTGFGPVGFSGSEFSSHTGYAVIRSGEDFGRLLLQGSVNATEYDGKGLYDGAYRRDAVLEVGYGITRAFAGLVEVGYEQQRYNTVPVTRFEGLIWAAGLRFTPNEATSITVKYGRRDGYNSAFVQGSTELGPRTRMFASYTDRLSTSALRSADLLQSIVLDPLGNPVDAQTGAPVLPSSASSLLGIQGGLFRTRSATVSLSHTLRRDVITLALTHEDRRPVAAAPAQTLPPFSQKASSISLSWSRPLDELTNLTAFARYGITTREGRGDINNYTAGASLTRLINPTLAGSLSYRVSYREGGGLDGSVLQNIIIAAVRQTF